jgi:valyl-tRNA synthetase
MMQTHLKERIEKATRKEFPDGIAANGTDALRFTLASIATNARDLNLDIARVEGYQRFCTKLWNATRFVISRQADAPGVSAEPGAFDFWIRSELGKTIRAVESGYASHRMDLVAQALYDFVWHEFCDWYLELSKPGSGDVSPARQQASIDTLAEVLGAALRLLHPLMPYITEELWLGLCDARGEQSDSIMVERLPDPVDYPKDESTVAKVEWLKAFIVAVRQLRGEMNIKPSQKLTAMIANASDTDSQLLNEFGDAIARLAGVCEIEHIAATAEVPESATVIVGDMRVLIPLAGVIDVAGERARLEKLREKNAVDIAKLSAKLDNPGFTSKAPSQVVAKDRERLAELQQQNASVDDQLRLLSGL